MRKPHIAVIGAGAFGGWSAWCLLRRGSRVTLVDAWGPGNSRASSGGETRIFRGGYGPDQPYTRMAARALSLWREHEERWSRKFLHRIGVLWMVGTNDSFERASLPELTAAGLEHEQLSISELERRWPQINFEGVEWGLYEKNAGYLTARASCQAVVEAFVAEGGEFRQAWLSPGHIDSRPHDGFKLSDGTKLVADHYVFACGPWLSKLFPEAIGDKIRVTKQEVVFFGTPAYSDSFEETRLPVWADHGQRFFYGIPGNQYRGFKLADDTRGVEFDPSEGDRIASAGAVSKMRHYLAYRFPAMKDAPVVETRVCQYENTPDNNFIIDRHPSAENVWIVGGGSGHGFKHGPAVGEVVAQAVLNQVQPESVFRLARFIKA
jgi:glycine/D-amino acid oxidase-like deaminating enzyme